jgi:diguanylate cyclase (GGDEF)-like protein
MTGTHAGQPREGNPQDTTPAVPPSRFSRVFRQFAAAAGIGLLVLVASWLGILSRSEHQLASFWPTNALLLGVFARRPALATPLGWLAAAAGYLGADLLTGGGLAATLRLTGANLAGVAVGCLLLHRFRREDLGLQRAQSMLRVLMVCAGAAFAAALSGCLIARSVIGADLVQAIGIWFSAELVSYVALVPVVLLLPSPRDLRHAWREPLARFLNMPGHRLPALSLLLTVLLGVAIGGPGAIAFPVPALLWCALSYRLFTTATATALLCIWTLVGIANGWIDLHVQDDMAAIVSMRIGMALVAVAPLTVAGAHAARNRLLNALNHAANHDALTQTLSRRAFERRGEAALERARAQGGALAVLMVDLDHFKAINDRHGHAAGDIVLVAFAERARRLLREGDLLGRFGGEEFAILMPGVGERDARRLAEQLLHVSAQPFELEDGRRLDITISIGLAMQPPLTDSASLETLLKRADRALYQAKFNGRNRMEQAPLPASES